MWPEWLTVQNQLKEEHNCNDGEEERRNVKDVIFTFPKVPFPMTAKKSKSVGWALKQQKRAINPIILFTLFCSLEISGCSTEFRQSDIAKPHPDKCLSAKIPIRATDCGFAEGPRLTSSWEEDCDRCWRTNKHEGSQTLSIWETFVQPHNESSALLSADLQWSADRRRCHWTVCASKTEPAGPKLPRLMTKHINITLVWEREHSPKQSILHFSTTTDTHSNANQPQNNRQKQCCQVTPDWRANAWRHSH